MKIFLTFCALALVVVGVAQNQAPEISNLSVEVLQNDSTLVIEYDLTDSENDEVEISAFVSTDLQTFPTKIDNATGDIGFPTLSGIRKRVTWRYGKNLPASGKFRVKLVADDRQPIDVAELVAQVDSTRIKADLTFIQGIRHRRTGAAHLAAVKDSIENHFNSLGFDTKRVPVVNGTYTGHNILGRKQGTTLDKEWYLLGGHFDSVDGSPGADDNGSAIAGTFEAARILSKYQFRKSIKFVGFDMEEDGLIGSNNFVRTQISAAEKLLGFIDFEMIGYYTQKPNTQRLPFGFEFIFPDASNAVKQDSFRGNFITNVGNAASSPLRTAFENAARQFVPALRVITLAVPGNGTIAPDLLRSDHAPFWLAGHQALMLTDGSEFRYNNYHKATDVLDSLNFTFMSRVVQATVATLAELAGIQHADAAVADFELLSGVKEINPCSANVFPNPFSEEIHWDFEHCRQLPHSVELLDLMGKVIFKKEFSTGNWLKMSELPSGVYELRFLFEDKFLVKRIEKL